MAGSFAGAVAAGILTADQARKLEAFMMASDISPTDGPSVPATTEPRFDLAHVLWYFGALIIIGAMGLFSTLAFSQMGARALLVTALAYAGVFVFAGHHLWHQRDLPTPGGLLIAAAISMVPLAIFSIQDLMGWWSTLGKPGNYKDFYVWIKGGFVPMEVGTILAALLALRFYRFPFILFIASVALWFMSMDLAEWLKGSSAGWDERRKISLAFGLVLIPLAWAVDLRRKDADFGFWLHLVGIVTFWGGLTFQESSSEIGKFLYFLINLGLIGLSVFLSRRVYAVFGGIGAMIYFGNLASKVFKDSLLFPFALSAIGLGVIGLGLLYYRRSAEIEQKLQSMLPDFLLKLRPSVRV
ncbi:MAG: hypothetical protein ACKVON_16735 [Beijerinckiaceae bacterium]